MRRLPMIVLIGLMASPTAAMGATIYPTRTDDPAGSGHCPQNCSLRQAIAFAQPGDTISLAPPAHPGPYVVTQGELTVSRPLTITGLGARTSTVTAITGPVFRDAGSRLTLSKLGVTGVESAEALVADGAAHLAVLGSSVSDNPGAVGVAASGTVRIANSTIANNGSVGLSAAGAAVDVSNSTIANNQSFGLSLAGDATTLASDTIAYNGNGSEWNISAAGGALTIRDSIIAHGKNANCSMASVAETATYSIEDQNSCGFTGTGDQPNTDPLLLPLANYGGQTDTMALAPHSPAINAGDPAGCMGAPGGLVRDDQRGAVRTGRCDVGAFELQAPPVVTVRPTITGRGRVGNTETCHPGTWSGGRPVSFAFQWFKDGSPLHGHTQRTLRIPGGTTGHSLACQVAASNYAGTATARSAKVIVKAGKH